MVGWGQELGPVSLALQTADPSNATSAVTGVTPRENPHAWNSVANMLFVDSPAGTGLSYCDNEDSYSKNHTQIQADLYDTMQGFFQMWPELPALNFFMAGRALPDPNGASSHV